MKVKLLGKSKETEIPSVFSAKIREDIAQKYFETEKLMKRQPYGPNPLAGKLHSASGKLKHRRRKWKTTYGHGISRVPRKIFWRRGTQFYWVGAFVASTRGGRTPHAPKLEHFLKKKKINKKEILIALKSAVAATASPEFIKKRYSTLADKKPDKKTLPFIIDSDVLKLKTKEFFSFLRNNLKNFSELIIKKKSIRAGKGKRRNRKYKTTAGLLLVTGSKEEKKIKGIDVKKLNDLEMKDLMPLGRLTVYTESAVQELNKIKLNKK